MLNPSSPKSNTEAWVRSGGMVLGIASVVVTCTVFLYSNFPAIREINAMSARISDVEQQGTIQINQLRSDHDSQIKAIRDDQKDIRKESIGAQKEVRDELKDLRSVMIEVLQRLPAKKFALNHP